MIVGKLYAVNFFLLISRKPLNPDFIFLCSLKASAFRFKKESVYFHNYKCIIFYSGNVSRDYCQKTPLFPEKMGIRMRPFHAFEWGGGGYNEVFFHYHPYQSMILPAN